MSALFIVIGRDKNMAKKGATYSAKSARHAEHKHLFGSGGKSDFIINMTAQGAQKLCGV